jgi:transcriptional regulator with XRE-family HTH domain
MSLDTGSVPGVTDPDPSDLIRTVGAKIRERRKAMNLSLEQLAQKAGVSVGLISGVERGLGNPSFNALVLVTHTLNMPMATLMHQDAERNPVVRREDRRSLDFHGTGETDARHLLLTAGLAQNLEVVEVTAPPGYTSAATPFQHPGEEFGLVLSGRHDVYLDGKKHVLGPGDSITYSSTIPHWYQNSGEETVTALWVITPPTF